MLQIVRAHLIVTLLAKDTLVLPLPVRYLQLSLAKQKGFHLAIVNGFFFKQFGITVASLSVHSILRGQHYRIPCHFRTLYTHRMELHDWPHHH